MQLAVHRILQWRWLDISHIFRFVFTNRFIFLYSCTHWNNPQKSRLFAILKTQECRTICTIFFVLHQLVILRFSKIIIIDMINVSFLKHLCTQLYVCSPIKDRATLAFSSRSFVMPPTVGGQYLSSRSFISRQRWAVNIYVSGDSIYLHQYYYTRKHEICQ